MLTLGEKIRKARLEQGITQSELCGEFITRNMLSKIENGSAAPSLPTIEYLAGRLNIPIGYFVSASDEFCGEFAYKKAKLLPRIKAAYKTREYGECIRLCESLPDGDDELCYILASSYYYQACANFKLGDFNSARLQFNCACTYADKSIYNTEWIILSSTVFLDLMSPSVAAGEKILPAFTTQNMNIEALIYLSVINSLEHIDISGADAVSNLCGSLITNQLYLSHIKARVEAANGNYASAKEILNSIADSDCSAFVKYTIYSDLEICCTHTGDYEKAYYCTKAKSELSAKMFS